MINLSIGKGRYITCCQIQNCIVRAWTPAETGYCHAHTYCIWLNVVIFSLLLIYRQMDELKLTHCTLWKKNHDISYITMCVHDSIQCIFITIISIVAYFLICNWYFYSLLPDAVIILKFLDICIQLLISLCPIDLYGLG